MDINRLNTGEKLAGVSAILLFLIMFFLDWFGAPTISGVDLGEFGEAAGVDTGVNAWNSMDLIRFILLLTVIAGGALAVTKASQTDVDMPIALSAVTAGLGILSVVLVAYRVLDPVGELDRELGLFLGLFASIGVAAGGWMAMQEEGTSFGDQADNIGGGSGGSPPPPPAQQ